MFNKKYNEKITSFILVLFLNGCANNMKPQILRSKPRLVIEDYLSGNVKAWTFYKIDRKVIIN